MTLFACFLARWRERNGGGAREGLRKIVATPPFLIYRALRKECYRCLGEKGKGLDPHDLSHSCSPVLYYLEDILNI